MIDLKQIELSISKQFYLLKHFQEVDADFRKALNKTGAFSARDIYKQLAIPGSKFNTKFAENPLKLWEKIQEFVNHQFIHEKEKFIIQKSFQNSIGWDALMPLSGISAEQQQQISLQERDGYLIKTLTDNMPETNKINIIISDKFPNSVITIFPGTYAPPIPNADKQSEKEYSACQVFWDNHVFIT